jgi:hypothetical protein
VLAEHLAGRLFLLARDEQAERAGRELLAHSADLGRRARMAWTLAYTLLRTGRAAQALEMAGQALADPQMPQAWQARLRSVTAMLLLDECRDGDGARRRRRWRPPGGPVTGSPPATPCTSSPACTWPRAAISPSSAYDRLIFGS